MGLTVAIWCLVVITLIQFIEAVVVHYRNYTTYDNNLSSYKRDIRIMREERDKWMDMASQAEKAASYYHSGMTDTQEKMSNGDTMVGFFVASNGKFFPVTNDEMTAIYDLFAIQEMEKNGKEDKGSDE